MTGAPPPTARARRALLSLAALVLLGTVGLWVGTREMCCFGTTKSLPGKRGLSFEIGEGAILIECWQLGEDVVLDTFPESFFRSKRLKCWPVSGEDEPRFAWDRSRKSKVELRCPVWFPGAPLGGVLLGIGLLCGRGEVKGEEGGGR